MLKVKDVADQLGVSTSAVRKYEKQGRLKSKMRTPGGQRLFTQESVDSFLGKHKDNIIVFYARSSSGSKTAIQNQIDRLTDEYGTPTKIYKDSGSGLNENRKQLNSLMDNALKHEFNQIAITNKDRLTRFGFNYLEKYFNNLGIEILVLEQDEKQDLHQELMSDFMSLIASFSGRFYRLRGKEQQKELLKTAEAKISE